VALQSDKSDVPREIFDLQDPCAIASSLKNAAEQSRRRRTTPFRSAMSKLTFYINRAGAGLDPEQRRILEQAKEELRSQFGRSGTVQ